MNKDDLIGCIIKYKEGYHVQIIAIVGECHNYGSEKEPDWYIQGMGIILGLEPAEPMSFYWKQSQDGGTLINPKEVIPTIFCSGGIVRAVYNIPKLRVIDYDNVDVRINPECPICGIELPESWICDNCCFNWSNADTQNEDVLAHLGEPAEEGELV